MAEEFVTKEEFTELLKLIQRLTGHTIKIAQTTENTYHHKELNKIQKELKELIKEYKK